MWINNKLTERKDWKEQNELRVNWIFDERKRKKNDDGNSCLYFAWVDSQCSQASFFHRICFVPSILLICSADFVLLPSSRRRCFILRSMASFCFGWYLCRWLLFTFICSSNSATTLCCNHVLSSRFALSLFHDHPIITQLGRGKTFSSIFSHYLASYATCYQRLYSCLWASSTMLSVESISWWFDPTYRCPWSTEYCWHRSHWSVD